MYKNNIIPIDISSSREYYGLNNSTDVYKGTSFKFSGKWATNVHYFNDEYIIDFVSWNGSLWACQRNHLSTTGTEPNINSRFWTEVITGIEGKAYVPRLDENKNLIFTLEDSPSSDPIPIASFKGDRGDDGLDGVDGVDGKDGVDGENGLTYRPDPELEGNYIVFRTEKGDVVKVDFSQFKGEKGDKGERGTNGTSWIFSKAIARTLSPDQSATVSFSADDPSHPDTTTYTLHLGIPQGKTGDKGLKGDTGKQGLPGDRGPANELRIEFDPVSGMSILYYSIEGTGKWERLGPVGGMPGKSPKLIREKGDPNLREDDRILWGYDGVPVSEWTTLCYLEELRGDENIAYGTPDDFEGGAPSIDKIWYDPSDEAVDQFSITDFLYQAYLGTGGNLNKENFEKAFANLSNISGFEVVFAANFEALGEPTKDKLGKLWLIPADQTGVNDLFNEYIVVRSPSTIEETYMWEKWGSEVITVDLSNYYTKDEVNQIKKELEDKIVEVSSTIWNDVNN